MKPEDMGQIQMEYPSDKMCSPSTGAVTRITCKNLDQYGYCLKVILNIWQTSTCLVLWVPDWMNSFAYAYVCVCVCVCVCVSNTMLNGNCVIILSWSVQNHLLYTLCPPSGVKNKNTTFYFNMWCWTNPQRKLFQIWYVIIGIL